MFRNVQNEARAKGIDIVPKVVDIFGNDSMTIVDVSVGDEKWLR